MRRLRFGLRDIAVFDARIGISRKFFSIYPFDPQKGNMEKIELKDWLPLLVGVVTAAAALLGVALSSYFSHRNTRATLREQRQLRADERRLERMEELFVVFARWEMNLSQVYLLNLRRHKGLLTQSQVHELVAKHVGTEGSDIHRMSMLLRIHFPELERQYAAVQEARRANVPFIGESSRTDVSAFIKAQEHFEESCEAFKQAIAALPKLSDVRAI